MQTKHGYRRKYMYGGSRLLDTLTGEIGWAFTSSAAKTLGQKAVSAATSAVEKGEAKAVDHVDKMTSKRRSKSRYIQDSLARSSTPSKAMTF